MGPQMDGFQDTKHFAFAMNKQTMQFINKKQGKRSDKMYKPSFFYFTAAAMSMSQRPSNSLKNPRVSWDVVASLFYL